jgi:hypothetical protein
LGETIRRERHLYEKIIERPIFQKSWNEKMKGKKVQRNKCFKPPFFKKKSPENKKF